MLSTLLKWQQLFLCFWDNFSPFFFVCSFIFPLFYPALPCPHLYYPAAAVMFDWFYRSVMSLYFVCDLWTHWSITCMTSRRMQCLEAKQWNRTKLESGDMYACTSESISAKGRGKKWRWRRSRPLLNGVRQHHIGRAVKKGISLVSSSFLVPSSVLPTIECKIIYTSSMAGLLLVWGCSLGPKGSKSSTMTNPWIATFLVLLMSELKSYWWRLSYGSYCGSRYILGWIFPLSCPKYLLRSLCSFWN